MPFPDSERVIYGRNPLVEVICQLRFPTILRISEGNLSDFQDKVRTEYPLYGIQPPELNLADAPPELTSLMQRLSILGATRPNVHKFSTRDSRRSIALAPNFVALTTNDYTRWETFRSQMNDIVGVLNEVYHPAFYTRVGLRYKDIISRSQFNLVGANWSDLIEPHILGLLSANELEKTIDNIITHSTIAMPDIPNGGIRLSHGIATKSDSGEKCYLIDADFYVANEGGLNDTFDYLDRFNQLARRLFRWAITTRLHRAMEPQSISHSDNGGTS